ncbi:MAG: hypothetical protein H5T69_19955, partial [Chloroflexi bacterium]|nr:hypothetical protein [Chloroflexota bacterium]
TQGSPFADDLAAWSALLLGSLSLLRFEWPTMIWPLLALFIPLRATNMRHLEATWRTWLRVLLVSLALGFVISVAVAPFYLATRAIYLLAMPRLYSLLLIAAVVMGLLVWALKMSGGQLWAWATVIAPWIRWAVVGGWLLCILYAGAKLWQSGLGASFPGWLLQYVGAPLVVLGALGAIWFTSRNRSQAAELTALLGLGAFFSLLYSARSLVMPVHPWAIRRAVPIVLPALAAGAGWLLADGLPTLWQRVRRGDFTAFTRRFGPALCAVTTAAVAWSAIKPMLPFLTYVERQGLYTQLASWADSLPEDAVLLFGQGPVAERLTQAMEMIFGRPSFVLQDTGALRSESPVTDHLVRSA